MKKHKYIYAVGIICMLLISKTNAQNNAIFGGGNSGGNTFNCVGSNGNISPLPIELLSFSGSCTDKTIVLNWSTASEINNDYFTLERSDDAETWVIAGILKGAGNSTNKIDYRFTDPTAYATNTYYRLKQTDYNGDQVDSKVIFINDCMGDYSKKWTLYPNPTTGIVQLTLDNVEQETLFSITIYNDLGQRVYYSIAFEATINLSELPNGIYSVLIAMGGNSYAEKVVILK